MSRLAQRLLVFHLPVVVKPDSKDGALPPAVIKRVGLRAALLVPLVCRGRVLGVLWLDDTVQSHYFTSKEINIVQGIATSVAVALDDASRLDLLEAERRRFDALARSLSDGVIALDPQLRILEIDRGAEDLLGWPAGEVRGRPVNEVFAISAAEAAVSWTREGAAPSPAPKRLQLRSRNGTPILCVVHAVPVRNAAGETVQILYALKRASDGSPASATGVMRPQARAQRVAPPE
jgi:PAS domain S-box-containing protein